MSRQSSEWQNILAICPENVGCPTLIIRSAIFLAIWYCDSYSSVRYGHWHQIFSKLFIGDNHMMLNNMSRLLEGQVEICCTTIQQGIKASYRRCPQSFNYFNCCAAFLARTLAVTYMYVIMEHLNGIDKPYYSSCRYSLRLSRYLCWARRMNALILYFFMTSGLNIRSMNFHHISTHKPLPSRKYCIH